MFAGSGGAAGPRGWGPCIGAGDRTEAWQTEGDDEGDECARCDHSCDDDGDSGAETAHLRWERSHPGAPALGWPPFFGHFPGESQLRTLNVGLQTSGPHSSAAPTLQTLLLLLHLPQPLLRAPAPAASSPASRTALGSAPGPAPAQAMTPKRRKRRRRKWTVDRWRVRVADSSPVASPAVDCCEVGAGVEACGGLPVNRR